MLNIVCDPNIRVINVIHHWLIVITQLAFFACQSDVFDWYSASVPFSFFSLHVCHLPARHLCTYRVPYQQYSLARVDST